MCSNHRRRGTTGLRHVQQTGVQTVGISVAAVPVTGILGIVAAIRLRKLINNEWLLALAGIASVAFWSCATASSGRRRIGLDLVGRNVRTPFLVFYSSS
jgi:hypothetical protein